MKKVIYSILVALFFVGCGVNDPVVITDRALVGTWENISKTRIVFDERGNYSMSFMLAPPDSTSLRVVRVGNVIIANDTLKIFGRYTEDGIFQQKYIGQSKIDSTFNYAYTYAIQNKSLSLTSKNEQGASAVVYNKIN